MKSKIVLLILSLLLLVGCETIDQQPTTPPSIIETETPTEGGTENPKTPDNPVTGDEQTGNEGTGSTGGNTETGPQGPVQQDVEFVVSLVYNEKIFIPEEEISVIWLDDYSQYEAQIGEDGYAKKTLDGDFTVILSKAPEGYTYNPNVHIASSDSPVIQIEIYKVSKISKGRGTGLYSEYEITNAGYYRANLKNKSTKVFYEYNPKKAGYYVIESLVSVCDDVVNPMVDIYTGTFASKYFSETLNTGGASKKGGYTKNFKWIVRLSQAELSNVFTFAIYADSKTGTYPVTVDFSIIYTGEYYPESTVSKLIVAEEANFKTDEYSKDEFVFINSDHGKGSYYGAVSNGTGILSGKDYKYNEETGYWHRYYEDTNTFGPILCAKISQPCAYYEESLNLIESHGNKNLTVENGTENYKQFVEVDYTLACNSDGVCYVTMELKEFLQKFSVSQRLFFDGNGFVESTGVYAIEEDQWLFACGYYVKK